MVLLSNPWETPVPEFDDFNEGTEPVVDGHCEETFIPKLGGTWVTRNEAVVQKVIEKMWTNTLRCKREEISFLIKLIY